MIRFRVSSFFPKQQLYKDPVFGIVTKNTLFGVHRTIAQPGLDRDCSKTMMVLGGNRKVTEQLIAHIEDRRQGGLGVERVMMMGNNENVLESSIVTNLAPLKIEQFSFGDMEQMCCIHNFDMFIVFSIQEDKTNYPSNIIIDGFEHVTQEWPQRSIVERYMRDMLYKD